jgi:non-heme chloroperoxidase
LRRLCASATPIPQCWHADRRVQRIPRRLRRRQIAVLYDTAIPFFGGNRPGATVSKGILDSFWLQGGFIGLYECIKAFSETNFTDDLKKIDGPALVLHGDDDQIVPIGDAGLLSAKLIPGAQLTVYAGAPHGMPITLADRINTDLLAFIATTAA